MTFTYNPKGVCSRQFVIEVNDGKVGEVRIMGGCSGNLQGIASLLRGVYNTRLYTRCRRRLNTPSC